MTVAVYHEATGQIERILFVAALGDVGELEDGMAAVAVPAGVDDSTHYIAAGAPVAFPARPHRRSTWCWSTLSWRCPELDQLRADAWGAVKAQRSIRLSGTFWHDGIEYQIDMANVPGAALDAMRAQLAGEPWQQTWVLADNSTRVLDAAQMIAVGAAMRTAISALWATSEALRAQIQAATTAEQIAAVTWPA